MTTIFICIDWFHPAYKAGGPIQSIVNLVRQYGHPQTRFKIFCSNKDLDGAVHEGVPFDEWCYFNEYTEVWYASRGKQTYSVFQRELARTNASVLLVIGMFSWYTKQWNIFRKGPSITKIISTRGMIHPGALTQKSFKKRWYIAAWRKTGLYKDYYFHATDPMEAQYIKQAFGSDVKVQIANNFPRVFPFSATAHKKAGVLRLITIGLVGPMKNIFLVLQALKDCRADIHYSIYGPIKDDAYWATCQELIRQLPANITVHYKGDLVPGKVEAALTENEVFILPSKSENFGHALYEALSSGRPVITSEATPFNDLVDHKAGINVSTGSQPEMVAAIEYFAAMPGDEFSKWNGGATVYAGKHLDIDVVREQYDKLFSTGINAPGGTTPFNRSLVRESRHLSGEL